MSDASNGTSQHLVVYKLDDTMNKLCDVYSLLITDGVPFKQAFELVFADKNINGDKLVEECGYKISADRKLESLMLPITFSMAYCAQAINYLNTNNERLAWACLLPANYWCGVAETAIVRELERSNVIQETRSHGGKVAGKKGWDNKFKEARDEAYRLAKAKRPPEKGWRSRAHAVGAIESAVREYAKSIGKPFVAEDITNTLDGWLKQMPEANELFPSRNKSSQ